MAKTNKTIFKGIGTALITPMTSTGVDYDNLARLIEEGGLAAVPGSCFGGEGHIRLSYCYSDEELRESLDRLEKFIRTL